RVRLATLLTTLFSLRHSSQPILFNLEMELMNMRLLKVTASILMLIATGTAGAATIFLDDFSTDTSANYNVRVVNARANSASPTMTVSDDNVNFTSTNTGTTQSVILHNSQTLGVGQ